MSLAYRDAGASPPAREYDSRLLEFASLLVRHRGPFACASWLITALAAATLLRVGVGLITNGVPLVFYLPAVSVVALFTGWQCGIIAVVCSTLLAWYLFVPPVLVLNLPNAQQALTLALWALVASSQVLIGYILRLALQRALHSETRYRKLLAVASGNLLAANERGEVETAQPGWAEITGMAWPEYAQTNWLKALHPDDRNKLNGPDTADGSATRQTEVRLWNVEISDWRWFVARSVAVPSFSGKTQEWLTAFQDIHEQKLASDRREILVGELRHRLKNLLTIIDALAKNSRSDTETTAEVEAFLDRFLGRLRALGAAADLVLVGNRVTIECSALMRATLAPFMEDQASRFVLSGGELKLSEETGGTLGLAIHEMATNALKYGALSADGGVVSVSWNATPAEDGSEQVVIEWKERGGPAAVPPNREGFGMRLIRFVPTRERGGDVQISYDPDGFYCRIGFLREAAGLEVTAGAA